MNSLTRRSLLVGSGAVVGAAGVQCLKEGKIPFGQAFPKTTTPESTTLLNDASLLSPTQVSKHFVMRQDPAEDFIAALRAELTDATASGRPVAVSAARHSMGGQSLAKAGTAITLEQDWLQANTQDKTYRVAAGMRWDAVIAELDKIGFSPKVMQSNNNFGVASTFAVNAHGWPVPWSAFGSTVRSLRMMRADGEIINCSRSENADDFNMAMGGYGLNGVIVDLDVEMVPNTRLEPKFETMAAKDFGKRFMASLKADPKIDMAYGRLDVAIDSFFEEALLITYTPAEDQDDLPSVEGSGFLSRASRPIFRSQVGSDRAKNLRWFIETQIGPMFGDGETTRNNLINEPVATLADRDPERTDILHEYFVSPDRFADFVAVCQKAIPSSYQELLNITLRFVDRDDESVLAYATEPRIAAVMLFSQEMSHRGEQDMARMTRELIEGTLAIGGTYYLPYRLHATDDQFRRAYPRAPEFAQRKRISDPKLLFRNAMWDRYFASL